MAVETAFVPNFDYDVFISYAWVDNQVDDDDQSAHGWVSQFRDRLTKRIDQKLGRIDSARVFFDTFTIGKNHDFGPQIEAALGKTAVMVVVFSPGYIESKACREELQCFSRAVQEKLSASGRLFLVHLDHVPSARWPAEVQQHLGTQLLGYPFYGKTKDSNDTFALPPDETNYVKELNRLRCAIAEQLQRMATPATGSNGVGLVPGPDQPPGVSPRLSPLEPGANALRLNTSVPFAAGFSGETTAVSMPPQIASPPKAHKPAILLAQSPPDLRKKRTGLAEYCVNAGLSVLGKDGFPADPDDFIPAFMASLPKAQVFVQLLSSTYSDPCPQFPMRLEQWQFQQAQAAGLPILQWRDQNLDLSDLEDGDPHLAFIQHPDVRRCMLANFHQEVVQRAQTASKLTAISGTHRPRRLALLKYNDLDKNTTQEVLAALKDANVTCLASNNGLSLVDTVREAHAHALIVVLGDNCPSEWLTQRGFELLKVQLAFRDQTPLRLYYQSEAFNQVPPLNDADVLEFRGRADLPRLVQAIHAIGGEP